MGLAGRFCEAETAVSALFTGRGPALTSGAGDFLFVAKIFPGPGGDRARSVVENGEVKRSSWIEGHCRGACHLPVRSLIFILPKDPAGCEFSSCTCFNKGVQYDR